MWIFILSFHTTDISLDLLREVADWGQPLCYSDRRWVHRLVSGHLEERAVGHQWHWCAVVWPWGQWRRAIRLPDSVAARRGQRASIRWWNSCLEKNVLVQVLIIVAVCCAKRGAAHSGSFPWVVGRPGPSSVQTEAAACCHHLHHPRHTAGTLPVCWECGLLQQAFRGTNDYNSWVGQDWRAFWLVGRWRGCLISPVSVPFSSMWIRKPAIDRSTTATA